MSAAGSPTVLIVHPGGLMPVRGGGAARVWALIDFLRSRGLRVDLITGNHGEYDAAIARRVDRLWQPPQGVADNGMAAVSLRARVRRRMERLRDAASRRLWSGVAPPGSRLATWLEENRRPSLELLTGQAAYAEPPLAVIAVYAGLARALDHAPPGVLRVLDTIDVQHKRSAVARAAGGDLSHIACGREEEARELRRADLLLAIQAEEADELRAMCPGVSVLLVQHAQAMPEYAPSPDASREVLCVGNLYDPNVRGLLAFLEQAWPHVIEAVPDARLVVAGRVGEAVPRGTRGVRVEGVVANIAPLYARAAAVINPVPYGTGLKIKSVEALTHGRCLVCTPAGLQGLGAPEELPVLCAETANGMAAPLIRMLTDSAARRELEARARAFAKARYSPEAVYGPFLDLLRARA